jgi:hypothetical protein
VVETRASSSSARTSRGTAAAKRDVESGKILLVTIVSAANLPPPPADGGPIETYCVVTFAGSSQVLLQ